MFYCLGRSSTGLGRSASQGSQDYWQTVALNSPVRPQSGVEGRVDWTVQLRDEVHALAHSSSSEKSQHFLGSPTTDGCFQLDLTRFLGGPTGGICCVARARNASAIRWGCDWIIAFQPDVSMTSVACLQKTTMRV